MITRPTSLATIALGALSTAMLSAPALAQDVGGEEAVVDMDETVFAGDYLVVGAGVAISPSYQGSDDYVFNVLPVVQGSLGGVDISPRAAGVKLDFVQDPEDGMGLDLGIAGRLRSDRARQITDDVVEQYGELDRAIEVGPTVGVNFPAVLNPYDSVSISTDVMWDINGAHGGMVVAPSVSYFTPLSRSIVASLSLSAEWADGEYHDYYFRVSDAAYTGLAPAPLPEFEPQGGGFTNAGANLLLGIDLDGDIANGGLGLIVVGGYSRVLGDAADTPFTSIRGTKDQFFGAVGIGYTF
ncbi:MipA/OmpV family protein [Aurantiacibacter poecillastricola]|uniref:MipA/OmpV family protein n=1 Tax=Aurantiacibacter poecillastricola TaxID=3064385 RepID=UPI00273F448B|nr:MipA/OmpV family protein [Aurantiacibacter sp. 219JJ12-13]MDP5263087.1 MipA/OmpV family protein [Aurantiacibacter sp. 219JJ12-13]